ncbi:hypothetical protein [Hymenobacter sp. BT190]|uniref:hypothetical protein n=1 Tax=Hymenobacter sp. BT190 TaxID=2763505 RepID=UPI0016515682|nr:hypothetical protein [Hymenobacter sp. BT190]
MLAIQSCETEENMPDIPYYKFTAANEEWLKLKKGENWIFETASGKQQKYIVYDIVEKIKEEYRPGNFGGIINGPSTATYYYDEVKIEVKRLDSIGENSLVFRRDLPTGADKRNPPRVDGQFKFGGTWWNYRGQSVNDGIYGNINIDSYRLDSQYRTTLQVKGIDYTNVILLSANSAPTYRGGYIEDIYYAQQAGIIRMVSRSGEIWDRVP